MTLTLDLVGDTTNCQPDCRRFLNKWLTDPAKPRAAESWWTINTRIPLALIQCGPGYLPSLHREERRMVRRANERYAYRTFPYNSQLDGIHAVNTSKTHRQGRPMGPAYQTRPQPTQPWLLCSTHRDTWFGAFEDTELAGYLRLEKLNRLGILNTILGKAGKTGVINGLIAHIAVHADVDWVNYLHMGSTTTTLGAFKRRLGFQPVLVQAERLPEAA